MVEGDLFPHAILLAELIPEQVVEQEGHLLDTVVEVQADILEVAVKEIPLVGAADLVEEQADPALVVAAVAVLGSSAKALTEQVDVITGQVDPAGQTALP